MWERGERENEIKIIGKARGFTDDINYSLIVRFSKFPGNACVFSIFAASVLAFSLIFSLAGRNEGKFFHTPPTT